MTPRLTIAQAAAEKPVRIQRKRTKGFRMPPNTIYVGRGSMWGNYAASRVGVTKGGPAVEIFCEWIRSEASDAWIERAKIDLRGKNLACWCNIISQNKYIPCHADVLISIANDIPMEDVIRENTRRAEGKCTRGDQSCHADVLLELANR